MTNRSPHALRAGAFLLVGLGLLAAGCGGKTTQQGQAQPTQPESSHVKLDEASHAEIMSFVKEQKGKVVLLDMWATW